MNYMVSLTPSHPPLGLPAIAPAVPSSEWLNVQLQQPQNGGGIIAGSGTWYKVGQISKPAQRCFIADSAALELEAWSWASSPALNAATPPPQGSIPFKANDSMYSDPANPNGQTTCDYYRHGVYPRKSDSVAVAPFGTYSPAFDPRGGKVSYNILFFDGHAVTSTDRADIYRAVRMRWPG
jgi:prepilin-type processing-associated H-X9-DG protein